MGCEPIEGEHGMYVATSKGEGLTGGAFDFLLFRSGAYIAQLHRLLAPWYLY